MENASNPNSLFWQFLEFSRRRSRELFLDLDSGDAKQEREGDPREQKRAVPLDIIPCHTIPYHIVL